MTHISRRLFLSATVAAALLAAGCATKPEVRSDRDPAADFGAYQTFAFYPHAESDTAGYDSLLAKHLLQATRVQMESRRHVYDERNPDLRVAAYLLVAERHELRSTGGGRFGYRGLGNPVETDTFKQGSLRIDVVDTRRNALVWQGVVEGRLDQAALQTPAATVQAAVGEAFAAYPRAAAQ